MNRCEEHREAMVAHLRQELPALGAQKLEAHLEHCTECSELHGSLRSGLDAVRGWSPEVSPAHLAGLESRLTPYVQAAHTRRRARQRVWRVSLVSLGAAAAAMALALAVTLKADDVVKVSPAVVAEASPQQVGEPASWTARELSRHVRIMHDGAWDGRVDAGGPAMAVTMSRGAAVFSFEGGQGRRLQISTVGALVEVVGTRFSVESDSHGTRVHVAEGVVRVLSLSGERRVHVGERVAVRSDGSWMEDVESAEVPAGVMNAAYLTEPFGRANRGEPTARLHRRAKSPRKSKAVSRDSEPAAEETPFDSLLAEGTPQDVTGVLAQLERAETMALRGRSRAALRLYEDCAEGQGAYATFQDLCRYEAARLRGFALGQRARARRQLTDLSVQNVGEVGRQATLAVCELDRSANPCEAARCLQGVVVNGRATPELRREAARLLSQWGLDRLKMGGECEQDGGQP